MRISEVLKHGRENATRADVLAAKLETTPRGLRRQIMLARSSSTPPAATAATSCRAMTQRLHSGKCRLSITSKPPGASMD